MNSLNLTGRLTKDAEFVQRTSKEKGNVFYILKARLAVTRDKRNKDGKRVTDFIPVQSEALTEAQKEKYFSKYFKKGALVSFKGCLKIDNYEDKDTKQYKTFSYGEGTFELLASPQNRNQDGQANIQSQSSYDESQVFEPQFEPTGFSAINDDDIPF